MADPNCDCCNPVAVWVSFIAWLEQAAAALFPPPAPSAPPNLPPPFLMEPNLTVRRTAAGRFQLGKPNYGIYDAKVLPSTPFTMIQEFATEPEANALARKLPRIRLPANFVNEMLPNQTFVPLPPSAQFNWTGDLEAKNTAQRLDTFLSIVPIAASLPGQPKVTLNLAKLPEGIRAFHRPFPGDPTRSLVIVDPYQINKGTLQLCASYIHELTHAQRHQARGFDRLELTSLLPQDEYVLFGLDEEFDCFENAVTAVKQFIATVPSSSRPPFDEWVAAVLEPPVQLYFANGLASMAPAEVEKRAHRYVGDSYLLILQQDYRDAHAKSLVPSAAANAWISSPEWAGIQATLPVWRAAGVLP